MLHHGPGGALYKILIGWHICLTCVFQYNCAWITLKRRQTKVNKVNNLISLIKDYININFSFDLPGKEYSGAILETFPPSLEKRDFWVTDRDRERWGGKPEGNFGSKLHAIFWILNKRLNKCHTINRLHSKFPKHWYLISTQTSCHFVQRIWKSEACISYIT